MINLKPTSASIKMKLKKIMNEKGINSLQLSQETEISEDRIECFILTKTIPSEEEIEILSDFFEVDKSYFVSHDLINVVHDNVSGNIKQVFSNNLKELIKDRGLSKIDIATALNISKRTLHQYLEGQIFPHERLSQIAKYFQVSAAELIEEKINLSDKQMDVYCKIYSLLQKQPKNKQEIILDAIEAYVKTTKQKRGE